MCAFRDAYPGVELIIKEDNALQLENLIVKGEIDFSVQILPIRSKEIAYIPICRETQLLAVPPHSVFADKDNANRIRSYPELSITELKDEQFILLKPEFSGRVLANEIFAEAGFSPKILLETGNLETAHALVASGVGVTIVTDTLVSSCPKKLKAAYFSIQGHSLDVVLVLAYKKMYTCPRQYWQCLK